MGIKLGRNPAAVVETIVQVLLGLALILWAGDQTLLGAVSAVVLAGGGLVTAAWVAKDGQIAALTGFIKAVFALVLVFKVDLDPAVETGVLMAVSALAMFWLRGQMTAPVTVDGVVLDSRSTY